MQRDGVCGCSFFTDMAYQPPKKLLRSSYRKEAWKNTEKIVRKLKKVLPISEMHLMGSFTGRKSRPADVDFMVLVHTPKNSKKNWSVDLVIAPDNKHGKEVLEDNKKWVKQRYGLQAGHIRLL